MTESDGVLPLPSTLALLPEELEEMRTLALRIHRRLMQLRGYGDGDAAYHSVAWFSTLRQLALAINAWLAPLFPEGEVPPEVQADGWLNVPLHTLVAQSTAAQSTSASRSLNAEMARDLRDLGEIDDS